METRFVSVEFFMGFGRPCGGTEAKVEHFALDTPGGGQQCAVGLAHGGHHGGEQTRVGFALPSCDFGESGADILECPRVMFRVW